MPDQVRHDDVGTFYDAINLERNQLESFKVVMVRVPPKFACSLTYQANWLPLWLLSYLFARFRWAQNGQQYQKPSFQILPNHSSAHGFPGNGLSPWHETPGCQESAGVAPGSIHLPEKVSGPYWGVRAFFLSQWSCMCASQDKKNGRIIKLQWLRKYGIYI